MLQMCLWSWCILAIYTLCVKKEILLPVSAVPLCVPVSASLALYTWTAPYVALYFPLLTAKMHWCCDTSQQLRAGIVLAATLHQHLS